MSLAGTNGNKESREERGSEVMLINELKKNFSNERIHIPLKKTR